MTVHYLKVENDGLRHSIVECLRLSCSDDDALVVQFIGENVKRLSDMHNLTFSQGKALVRGLASQFTQLNAYGLGMYAVDLDDILCIDDQFVVVKDTHLVKRVRNQLLICSPPLQSIFFPPEVKQINTLPASLHFQTCHYSIGYILTHFGLTEWKFKGVVTRCMHADVSKRVLCWI